MEIEDMGELRKFDTMPSEATLYITAVCYGGGSWSSGPSAMDKGEVENSLRNWVGITKARIYSVKVPLHRIDDT